MLKENNTSNYEFAFDNYMLELSFDQKSKTLKQAKLMGKEFDLSEFELSEDTKKIITTANSGFYNLSSPEILNDTGGRVFHNKIKALANENIESLIGKHSEDKKFLKELLPVAPTPEAIQAIRLEQTKPKTFFSNIVNKVYLSIENAKEYNSILNGSNSAEKLNQNSLDTAEIEARASDFNRIDKSLESISEAMQLTSQTFAKTMVVDKVINHSERPKQEGDQSVIDALNNLTKQVAILTEKIENSEKLSSEERQKVTETINKANTPIEIAKLDLDTVPNEMPKAISTIADGQVSSVKNIAEEYNISQEDINAAEDIDIDELIQNELDEEQKKSISLDPEIKG